MAKCCKDEKPEIKVERLTLDDGRKAEKHVSVDENGNEVVEIFAEEKRPLILEKRITKEHKQVLAKETHETVKDGEVVVREVMACDQDMPLKMQERIATVKHDQVVNGDYVRREEIGKIVADGVVEGISALMFTGKSIEKAEAPIFKAQSVVEKNVAEKQKGALVHTYALGGVIFIQVAILAYMMFFR